MALTFYPLHWVYHDCWQWTETIAGHPNDHITYFYHAGHIHYFFNSADYNASVGASGRAYGGTQRYYFQLKDIWGPNSGDTNQAGTDKLIGKPMWYFHIEEYWRRVYVQSWVAYDGNQRYPLHKGRSGIKYDASKPEHSLGPFREGGGLFFFNSKINRTLPVEHWLNEDKTHRELFVKTDGENTSGGQSWKFEGYVRQWGRDSNTPPNVYSYYDSRYHKFGDYVYMNTDLGRKYYKYTYKPYNYDILKNDPSGSQYKKSEAHWGNPIPNLKGDELWDEYLRHYGLTNEYNTYCTDNGLDKTLPSSYRKFVGTKSHYIQNLSLYEYYTFEDYSLIWQEVSEREAKMLDGDYPKKIKLFKEGDESSFGDSTNPFVKNGVRVNPQGVYEEYFDKYENYTIPRNTIADGDYRSDGTHPREFSFSDEDGARRNYPDDIYIYPIMEYQKVVHLDYERMPNVKSREKNINVYTDKTGNFGDGFEVTIELPYRVNDVIQSPFSKANGIVLPPGEYHSNIVKEENKLRYKVYRYNSIKDVQKYMNHKYLEFVSMREKNEDGYNLSDDEWFEENWKGKPILRNEDEGGFYETKHLGPIWMPYLTQHFITDDKIDEDGYNDSNGNLIKGDGKIIEFHNPYKDREDGVWIEQFLGGVVKAEVEVVLEDPFGKRRKERVSIVAARSTDTFEGVDKASQQ